MSIREMAMGTVLCYIMAFATVTCVWAGTEQEEHPVARKSLYYMDMPNGLEFSIRTLALQSYEKPQTLEVQAMLTRGGDLLKTQWIINNITTADFPWKIPQYYAVVKVMEDRIFVFFTWNGQYCLIAKEDGAILERGKGDDVLKQYDQLVLLKLISTSTFERVERPENEGQITGHH